MYTKPIDNARTTGKFYIQQIIFFLNTKNNVFIFF